MRLYDRLQSEPYSFAISNFLDEFRSAPDYAIIKDSVLDLSSLNEVQKSMIAATVDQLCGECKVQRPDWIFDERTFLRKPYFSMNAKGPLRIVLIQESPKWFRSRNLFVSANCHERV